MFAPDTGRLEELVRGFERLRLLVVGDLVLDRYVWGDVERVSPEAPVPIVKVREETEVLGGAGNVVRNAVALGARASFCSAVGRDAAGRRVAELLSKLGVDPVGLVAVEGRPTTRKTRIIARNQQLVRFDWETVCPLPEPASRALIAAIDRAIPGADGAALADYGKGVLAAPLALEIMGRFGAAGLSVVVDPKDDLSPFRGAALLMPNLREAEELAQITVNGPGDLSRAVEKLHEKSGGGAVVVTRGSLGMTLFESGGGPGVDVPTLAREVFDVQGAGDTAIACLALALRAGGSLLEASVIANAAAGVVVGKVGTATASADEVCELLPAAVEALVRAGEGS